MKQENYNLIVKAVTIGLPAVAREVIQDLNSTLAELERLTQPNVAANAQVDEAENKEEQ